MQNVWNIGINRVDNWQRAIGPWYLSWRSQLFFGKPIYDFLYVGNVHKKAILKDTKDIERWKLHKFAPFLKSRPISSLGKKVPSFFKHGWEKGRF